MYLVVCISVGSTPAIDIFLPVYRPTINKHHASSSLDYILVNNNNNICLFQTHKIGTAYICWSIHISSRSISAGLPISYCLHVKSRFSQRPPGVASHTGSL